MSELSQFDQDLIASGHAPVPEPVAVALEAPETVQEPAPEPAGDETVIAPVDSPESE